MICERCYEEIDDKDPQLDPEVFIRRLRLIRKTDGSYQRLRGKAWRILETLWRRRPRFVSPVTLFVLSQPRNEDVDAEKLIRVEIARIRQALVDTPYTIMTSWGEGYCLLRCDQLPPGARAKGKRATYAH